jgi:hypothetical protein
MTMAKRVRSDAQATPTGAAVLRPTIERVGQNPYPDRPLEERAEALAPGEPLKIQIRPLIYTTSTQATPFMFMAGVSWTLLFPQVADAKAFRADLDRFIRGWVEGRA